MKLYSPLKFVVLVSEITHPLRYLCSKCIHYYLFITIHLPQYFDKIDYLDRDCNYALFSFSAKFLFKYQI